MPEQDQAVARDPVDRALAALCELHDEQLRPALLRQHFEHLGQPHRDVPRPSLEQLPRAVGGRIEHAKAA